MEQKNGISELEFLSRLGIVSTTIFISIVGANWGKEIHAGIIMAATLSLAVAIVSWYEFRTVLMKSD